ncbi:MAG: GDSL-type esterase/lipase family protein, partial [Mucilaginibacter sp.]
AFHWLSIDKEGNDMASWLSKKGITAFVLKYRLEHTGTDPVKDFSDKISKKDFKMEKLAGIPLAIADGRAAIAYVRAHAAEYNVLPNRIGIAGFSAGGTVAASAAQGYNTANRPDFVAAIYPYMPKALLKPAAADSPPLFIAAAANDQLNAELQNTGLYDEWIKAKRPAEIHIYAQGGHGFGMSKQTLPADSWIDRFSEWGYDQGFFKPLSPEKTRSQKMAEGFANLQKYYDGLTFNDWAWRFKYREANEKDALLPAAKRKVVFMGNSITEYWNDMDPAYFKDNGYINRGIGGQVSAQMLVRFREDVIALKPFAVVIEAGTNDIAENRGPISLEAIFGNMASMCELAMAHGIKPILGSVPPAIEFSWHRGLLPAPKIMKLNEMLKAYAAKNNIEYIDYWSALRNDENGFKIELAQDRLAHPNLAGYKIMEPLAKKAIDITLKKK